MPQETIAATSDPAEPPSSIMKKFYTDLKGKEPSESELEDVARKCLLPIEDVSLWMDHLKTVQHNRKRGAAKAAESRKSKRHQSNCTSSLPSKQLSDNHPKDKQPEEEQEDYYYGTCEGLYGEGEEEYWIGCDGCFGWFHGECVSVTPDLFLSKMSFIIMIAQLCTIYTFLNNQLCGNYMYIIVVAVVLAVQSSTTVMLTCVGECINSSIR